MSKLATILSKLVWESPSEKAQERGTRARWETRLAPCVSHPDKWARVHVVERETVARSTVTALRKRRLLVPKSDSVWLFVTEQLPSEKWGIYACFLGKSKELDAKQ